MTNLDYIFRTVVTVKCRECGDTAFYPVNTIDYADYVNGVTRSAEKAFPYLEPQEVKAIETRVCPCCRKKRLTK